jgi:gliding motility-associated lipoprotein GldH
MRVFKLIYSVCFLCILLFSCSHNSTFEGYYSFDDNKWTLNDEVKFYPEIKDTVSGYNVYVTVRNTPKFENMNLWLFVKAENPDGSLTRDTINCFLADKRGHWLGSGLGDIFESRHVLKKKVLFPQSGKYKFTILNGMRDLDLKGLSDIGFSIEKIENK